MRTPTMAAVVESRYGTTVHLMSSAGVKCRRNAHITRLVTLELLDVRAFAPPRRPCNRCWGLSGVPLAARWEELDEVPALGAAKPFWLRRKRNEPLGKREP